jgi:2-polyprenyl-6-methoxyphenol hydroxylase-like FAD-dependent oxidoreductase
MAPRSRRSEPTQAARPVTPAGPFAADLIIGADGCRSIVRRNVAPDHPDATFAGYMLWRGLVEEAELPAQPPRPSRVPSVSVDRKGAYRLVAYYVPGADGSIEPGRRRISWAWYDPFQDDLLRKTGRSKAERYAIRLSRPPI